MDNAGDEDVKKVIACFTIETTGAEIIKKMTALTMLPLKKAAHYLDIPERVVKSKLKAAIISDIVDRLNALLMEFCAICEEYYHEDLKEKPLVKCILCHQGCHNPCQEGIILRLSEFDTKQQLCRPFMCSSCISDHSEEDPDTNMAHAIKNKKSPNKQVNKTTGNERNTTVTPNSPGQSNGVKDPNEGSGGDKDGLQPDQPNPENNKDEAAVPVCPDYKWGRCPNYEHCQFRHPPRCWTWLEKGSCSYKKKCRYHHPPICYNSLWQRECYNKDCKFFHLQKTKRVKIEEEQLKASLNAGNYQSQFPSLPQQNDANNQHNPENQRSQASNNIPSHQRANRPDLSPQQSSPVITTPRNHPPRTENPLPDEHKSPAQPRLSKEDLSFLVVTIKDILKEEIGKEIGEITRKMNLTSASQLQPVTHKQIQNHSLSPPLLQISPQIPNPTLYNLQVAPHQLSSQ